MYRLRKLITADKCSRYEITDNRRIEPYHVVTLSLSFSKMALVVTGDDLAPSQIQRRTYEFRETIFDEERGMMVDIYKELI